MVIEKQGLLNLILELKLKEEEDSYNKIKEIGNNTTAYEMVFRNVGVLDECKSMFKYNYIAFILELQKFEYILIEVCFNLSNSKYSNEEKLEIYKIISKIKEQCISNVDLLIRKKFSCFTNTPKFKKLDKSSDKYNKFLLDYYEKLNNCLYEIEKIINRLSFSMFEIYKYININEVNSNNRFFLKQFRDAFGILIDEYETKYLLTLKHYTENNDGLCITNFMLI